MAQAQVDYLKIKNKKDVATQTSLNDNEFFVSLSANKYARLYYSESYRDMVLSFNINRSKSFIVTKQMWVKFRQHILAIDKQLTQPVLTHSNSINENNDSSNNE
jgi:hypothetical protein